MGIEQKAVAILVAAGSSQRMGRDKLLLSVGGMPVLARTLLAFEQCSCIQKIVVVTRADLKEVVWTLAKSYSIQKLEAVVEGGTTRQQSVKHGVDAAGEAFSLLCIHDAARPFVRPQTILETLALAATQGAATAAVLTKDTIKEVAGGLVVSTPERSRLFCIQTPQAFLRSVYLAAYAQATRQDFTDDCQLVEAMGGTVAIAAGSYQNIKLTTPEDLAVAQSFLQKEQQPMRVGQGYDVHALVEDRRLILGGVDIPFERGLLGHSDADVLAHAVADALLGAAALGDLGKHFPDQDPAYKNADSLLLLQRVGQLLLQQGYIVGNIDCTVVAQAPKLAPYIAEMRQNLANALGARLDQVSIKATTEEGLGFTGRKEGISAMAICSILPK